MNCQHCHERPAQVQYTEVVGGSKRVEWLCPRCARERGITVELQSMPQAEAPPLVVEPDELGLDSELECPNCGLDLGSFRERGRVGCAECYEVFAEALEPLLRRVHHATEHSLHEGGRDARSRLLRVLETLRRELHEAVRREEFERAAGLRDEIRGYEEEARGLDHEAVGPSDAGGEGEDAE